MIDGVLLFRVTCDTCGKQFTNEEPLHRPNEVHLYTTRARAEEGIKKVGWVVLHNLPNMQPRIMCKRCNKKSDQLMKHGQN